MSLPNWQGADVAYSRAYTILEKLARTHVEIIRDGKRKFCTPSAEMSAAIDALNCGDEETIKAFNLKHIQLW